LGDLLQRRRLHVGDDRDAAEALVLRRRHGEAEDVEPAPGEEAGHPGQHTGPVLHEDGEDVVLSLAHRRASLLWVGGRTMSSLDWPAGTIGKTFSRLSTRNSSTTGR